MLDGLDLRYPEIYGLTSKVIDTDHEYWPAVGLKLPRGWLDQDERTFLSRYEGRLPIAHQCLLLRIGCFE
jgi:hypothetical protein